MLPAAGYKPMCHPKVLARNLGHSLLSHDQSVLVTLWLGHLPHGQQYNGSKERTKFLLPLFLEIAREKEKWNARFNSVQPRSSKEGSSWIQTFNSLLSSVFCLRVSLKKDVIVQSDSLIIKYNGPQYTYLTVITLAVQKR